MKKDLRNQLIRHYMTNDHVRLQFTTESTLFNFCSCLLTKSILNRDFNVAKSVKEIEALLDKPRLKALFNDIIKQCNSD